MAVFEFIRSWWPILMFILQAVVAVFSVAFWAKVASKDDIKRVEEKTEKVEERVKDLEQDRKEAPTRKDLHRMEIELERTRGEIREFRALFEGGSRELASGLAGVRDLHQQSQQMVSIMTEHLIGLRK